MIKTIDSYDHDEFTFNASELIIVRKLNELILEVNGMMEVLKITRIEMITKQKESPRE
jgi:hypothetical protein